MLRGDISPVPNGFPLCCINLAACKSSHLCSQLQKKWTELTGPHRTALLHTISFHRVGFPSHKQIHHKEHGGRWPPSRHLTSGACVEQQMLLYDRCCRYEILCLNGGIFTCYVVLDESIFSTEVMGKAIMNLHSICRNGLRIRKFYASICHDSYHYDIPVLFFADH